MDDDDAALDLILTFDARVLLLRRSAEDARSDISTLAVFFGDADAVADAWKELRSASRAHHLFGES